MYSREVVIIGLLPDWLSGVSPIMILEGRVSEGIGFLVERLRAEGEKTLALFGSLAEEQWKLPVYTEGETWTVRSLLAHNLSSEREMLRLFVDIQRGGRGAPQDFDLDRFNAGQQKKTADLAPAELLELFGSARAEMIAFVAGLEEAELEKQGRHPFFGIMALGDMIKVVYRHNRLHERDLRRILPA